MNHGPDDICARCQHFRMREYPEHAAVGLGRCHGYDKEFTQLANPFVYWGTAACAKYSRSWDEKRDVWIAKRQAQEQQGEETISRASASTAVPTR